MRRRNRRIPPGDQPPKGPSTSGVAAILRELTNIIHALTRFLEVAKPYLVPLLLLWT